MAYNYGQGSGSMPPPSWIPSHAASASGISPASASTPDVSQQQYQEEEEVDDSDYTFANMRPAKSSVFRWFQSVPASLYGQLNKAPRDIHVDSKMRPRTSDRLHHWHVSWQSRPFNGTLSYNDGSASVSRFAIAVEGTFVPSSVSQQYSLYGIREGSKLWGLFVDAAATYDDLEAYYDSQDATQSTIMVTKPPGGAFASGPWPLGTLSLTGYHRPGDPAVTTEPFEATFSIVELPP